MPTGSPSSRLTIKSRRRRWAGKGFGLFRERSESVHGGRVPGEGRVAGGTEIAGPLDLAVGLLDAAGDDRDRILVLVTDGQVGNEDQVLQKVGSRLKSIRVFTLGIDQAVNEGFLRRLAELGQGGGTCELVESEDRLDAVMEATHRRIGAPL